MIADLVEERRLRLERYAALAGDSLIVAVAMVGALAPLTGFGWGLPLLGLAVVAISLQMFSGLRSGQRPALGVALVPRAVIATGCALALATQASTARDGFAAALGAGILVLGTVTEPFLRRAARFQAPLTAHLPGIPEGRPGRDLTLVVLGASLGASLAGLLLAATGSSPWWFVAIAALALVPPVTLALTGRARILAARRMRTLVPAAVADYAPEFVLYTSRPDDASYQVTMWLPYLQRTGQRFLIITRNGTPARALAALTHVPIVEARRLSDLDGLVPPSLKAAFYVNASSGNGAFVRYQHLTHIYLGHGDSDKPPSYNPTHAMYDRIFAAGPAATRRYAAHGVRIQPQKFEIVGRPQVDGVHPSSGPISDVAQPVVLYAPTWRGHVEETLLYSLPVGERIVASLLARGATVIFRPHPFSYGFEDDALAIRRIQDLLAADARQSGRRHLWGLAAESERGIFDCINASDAMVSDVSSVVSDYLFSGKPFAMIAVPSPPESFVAEYPVSQAAYVVPGDLADLDSLLTQMLGQDPLAAQRRAIRVDYLGDFPADNYSSAFVEAVRAVTSKPAEDEDEVDDEESDTSAASTGAGWSGYGRLLVGVLVGLSGTVFALCSLAAALLGAPGPIIVALALLSQSAVLQMWTPDLAGATGWERLLGATEAATPRAILLIVVAVAAADGRLLSAGWVSAVVVLVVALVGELHIRTSWGRLGLEVHNLPAVNAAVPQLVRHEVIPLVSSVLILIDVVLAVLHAPAVLAVVLAVGFVALYLDSVIRAFVRVARVVVAEGRLRGALLDYAPEFALYFASTVGAAYQVGMWLPFLVRTGRPFIIITRNVPMMREIATLTRDLGLEIPVIQRPTLRSLEDVVVGSMSTCFYVNNAVRNAHFVERRELTHVWLNHGDSEKPACFNPVHAIYDLLFAAGQAGIDRYARHGITIPSEKFRIVGRPQVESIEEALGPVAELEAPTVLYAPTWQGPFADTRVYSLPLGREIVERLLARGVRVIFRAHPFNYRFQASVEMINDIGRLLAADRAATGRRHLWGADAEQRMTIEECFNASDAMVSDVSAVVSDYLRSNKPFAIVSVGRSPESLMRDAPAARAAYVINQDLHNLDQVYGDLLGPDPLAGLRRETKIYYLGDFSPDHYADGFLNAAREVIDAGRRH